MVSSLAVSLGLFLFIIPQTNFAEDAGIELLKSPKEEGIHHEELSSHLNVTLVLHNGNCIDIAHCDIGTSCDCARKNAKSYDESCNNGSGFIDYLTFHYCTMEKLHALSIIMMLVWLLFLFYMIISTTDDYFSPAISRLSDRLRLSSNVAGVTLVAFGNGSPDVFAAFAALSHGSSEMGIGGLIGSGVFVTLVVLAAVSLSANTTNITRRPFLRDTVFYLVAVGLTLVIARDGNIYLWEAIMFMSLYVCYVVVVFLSRYIHQRTKRRRREQLGIVEDANEELYDVGNNEDSAIYPMLDEALFVSNVRSWKAEKYKLHGELLFGIEDRSFSGLSRTWFQKINAATSWHEKSVREKLLFIIAAPTLLLRNLTIPVAREGEWNRIFAVLNPIFAPLFALFATHKFLEPVHMGKITVPVFAIVLVVGALVSIAVFFTTKDYEPPRYFVVFSITGFLMGICWLYVIATEIVCVLRTIGRIARISEQILGLTVVAWGNSVVDLVTNVIIAKQGYPDMAVSACFGAPTFNLLFGAGISLLYWTIRYYPEPFLVEFSMAMLIAFCFLLGSIVITIIAIPLQKFSITKPYAIFLIVLYLIFTVLSVLTELHIVP
eukprot:TRINITY_DN3410_c0_g1_i1.p1 TRINITY_DN3410_c0_g1~~TRINITY_DN3410_c0_g1_i1.p1  ORF type:complete len:605 (+),score=81.39 TRINITY_DN3410_c0_g1_i1:105-1919(+)